MTDGDLDPDLTRWVEESLGGRIARSTRAPTGGSRATYLVDVEREAEVVPVVVRVEGDGSFTGTELSLSREAVAYRALASTDVPAPAVLAERPNGSAVILERVPGTEALDELSEAERSGVMEDWPDPAPGPRRGPGGSTGRRS